MNLYHYEIKVERVVDGDTVDALIDLGFETLVRKRIRLSGINTPEKHTVTRKIGEEATAHLQHLIDQAAELRLQSEEIGKFGRVLGRLIAIDADGNASNLNQQMIDDGHALPYSGGKRSDADFLTPEFLRGRQPA